MIAERKEDKRLFKYLTRDLKALQKAKDKAKDFYLDSQMVKNSKKMQGILKDLINKK
ncbi:TPA: hypothetical protein RZK36_000212 [Campylobacter coli]|nr:hypothetical protein [Campylobacter jejuni]HEB9335524.1 hypothetical protein [Campylobacter coli]